MEIDESINPWKRKSTREIYDNPWVSVVEDQVVRPNNTSGIYGHVHFKNKAIGILPIDTDLNTWLGGQYRYTLNEFSWEIPTGGVPFSEDTLEGAKRELKEETGLVANKLTKLLDIHTSNSVTDEFGYIFIAEDLVQEAAEWDETEQLKIKKIPLKEALKLVMENEITDSLSIAGILKASRLYGI